MGSAETEGPLWSARSRDWAEVQEPTNRPIFEKVARRCAAPGVKLLDVGCGAGLFASMAAGLGAGVSGIDGAEAMLAIAKERTPEGDFRLGDMQAMPFGDGAFDVVTGFNSFQFAAEPAAAFREARRVARQGARLLVLLWDLPAHCETFVLLRDLGKFLPPAPPGAPGPFALSDLGVTVPLVEKAGFKLESIETIDRAFEYPDLATALRGFHSVGPAIAAVAVAGEAAVTESSIRTLGPFSTPAGGYRMINKFSLLVFF